MSFSTALKKVIESSFPNHKLISTSKGPGPELKFQIGNPIDGAKEVLHIYKSNWGQSFYIHLQIIFEIHTRGDKSMQIVYNDIRLGHPGNLTYHGLNSDQDLEEESPTYANDNELNDLIIKRKEKILALEEWFFKLQRIKYAEIADICAKIPLYYKKWYDVKDSYSYDKKILEQLKLEYAQNYERSNDEPMPSEVYEDPCTNTAEFHKFICYLIMHKLGNKEFLEPNLWIYWTTGRPFTKADFIKGDYHYCLKCGKFLSKGDYIKFHDKIFGEYYEFICAKCLKKENIL